MSFLCACCPSLDPSIWVPSVSAILAAGITAVVSFIILGKQIASSKSIAIADRNHNSKEASKERKQALSHIKYQTRLQQIISLEEVSLSLIKSINPHKLYNLEMLVSVNKEGAIDFINMIGDELDSYKTSYCSKVKRLGLNNDNHCEQLDSLINQYHQMLRDVQEVIRGNIHDEKVFIDSTLVQLQRKYDNNLPLILANYFREKDTKIEITYNNVSKSISELVQKAYEDADSLLS